MSYAASSRHQELEQALVVVRQRQPADEEVEDTILDEMESVWYKMTPNERKEAESRAAAFHAGLPTVQLCLLLMNSPSGNFSNNSEQSTWVVKNLRSGDFWDKMLMGGSTLYPSVKPSPSASDFTYCCPQT